MIDYPSSFLHMTNTIINMEITKNTIANGCSLLAAVIGTLVLVFCDQNLWKWIGALFTIASPIINLFVDPVELEEF